MGQPEFTLLRPEKRVAVTGNQSSSSFSRW